MSHKVKRPWGWYKVVVNNPGYLVKEIYVEAGKQTSLQYHVYRDEVAIRVTEDGVDSAIIVHKGDKHRLEGGNTGRKFIELQYGLCLEEDVVRIEDDYGRVSRKNS